MCVFSTEYIPKNQAIPRRRQLFCESTQQQPLALYVCVLVLELAKSRLAVFGSWSLLRVENRWQLLLYDDTGELINEIKKTVICFYDLWYMVVALESTFTSNNSTVDLSIVLR